MINTPLSRIEKRFKARVEKDAHETHARLAERFFTFFIDNEPDSFEVSEMEKQVCAKWRLYCASRRLNPEAFTLLDKYCKSVREEFNKQKNDKT